MRQIVEIARQTLLALIGSLVLFCGSALAAAPEPTYDQALADFNGKFECNKEGSEYAKDIGSDA